MSINKEIIENKNNTTDEKANMRELKEEAHNNAHSITFKKRIVAYSKLILLLFILIIVPIVIYLLFKNTLFDKYYLSNISDKLNGFKSFAFVPLIFFQIVQIVICVLPGQPIQFASSYLYGVLGGFLISICGAIIGTIITYYLARFLGNDALHIIFGEEKFRSYVRKLNSRRAYIIIFLIYLLPGVPKDFTSYVAGVSNVKLKPFLLLSIIGRSPGVLGSLLLGVFIAKRNYVGITILIVISIIILLLCYWKRDSMLKFIGSYEDSEDNKEDKNG